VTGPAYYNEHDPKAAAWLRELIKQGHIAPGVVDERSIEDITPADLAGYTQCHFFAGIGVWSYALRRAGWPDDKPVWTGSCPCQPFSAAGKGAGFADERHLWPAWFHLIPTAKPEAVPVFGEQVASKDGLAWLDLVQADMEAAGYAFGAVDMCAAGVGAPHIRQRLFFVAERMADTDQQQRDGGRYARTARWGESADGGAFGRVGYATHEPRERLTGGVLAAEAQFDCQRELDGRGSLGLEHASEGVGQPAGGPTNGLWADADWLYCRDGKWRPVEPGAFPLVDGAPARVGRLRGYGNAINAEVAQSFIEAAIGAGVGQ